MSKTEEIQVQERASTPSLPKSHAFDSWQGSEGGPEKGKAEGGTSEQEPCERNGEGKVGIGPEERRWGHRRAKLTHRHVGARSNKGVGHGIYELAAHTEVAQLDLPAGIDQDVGGLDVYVGEEAKPTQPILHFQRHLFAHTKVVQLII